MQRGTKVMNLTKEVNGKELVIGIDGRLDTQTAPELETFINENCADVDALTLDCEKLTYVSSAGLRVFLTFQKKMQGSMKLKNVCEIVMEVFEMTGFADILTIE